MMSHITAFFLLLSTAFAQAELWLPSIFGENMVLQRGQENPVWGTTEPGAEVQLSIHDQNHTIRADNSGEWRAELAELPVGGPYDLTIVSGSDRVVFGDVLVGEVWLCSGQSNMQWDLSRSVEGDLERLCADNPMIRLISVPQTGSQVPLKDFKGNWEACTPDVASSFSAVGYYFGKRLQEALNVPIGLIDNSWGGSIAEAWLPRDILDKYPRYAKFVAEAEVKAANYTDEMHAERVARFEAWKAGGRKGQAPWPTDPRTGQNRPANLYNGVLNPIIGYGIRGVIWYQGEGNVSRAEEYAHLFPLVIETWRQVWDQGDFPFYWVQLADFQSENSEPVESSWAQLRASQTQALSVPYTGQAVIIDIGEGRDIHPRNKRTVADRLVRHALDNDYGYAIHSDSPLADSAKLKGNTVVVSFKHVSEGGLYAFDQKKLLGFSLAGSDGVHRWAEARIEDRNRVLLHHPEILEPRTVRYAWADNPVANLIDLGSNLPATPFELSVER
jgi:sialate O-acetylesterase